MRRMVIVVAALLGIMAAGAGGVLLVVSPSATAAPIIHRTTLAPNTCTRAYGQCEVTEYREHLRNGVVRIWTCFAQPPVKPGASNIWIAVDDCYRP